MLGELGEALTGKVLIDVTNRMKHEAMARALEALAILKHRAAYATRLALAEWLEAHRTDARDKKR